MLLVAFYGGPGLGKSVAAMRVAAELKCRGVNAEYVPEYAKDLTWEGRKSTLGYQPYIAAKQMWAIDRLEGQVDVVVTDSSPLLGLVYGNPTPAFSAWLVDDYTRRDTINIILRRRVGYFAAGRNQSYEEAVDIDQAVDALLPTYGFNSYSEDPTQSRFVDRVCANVQYRLDKQAVKE